MNKKLQMISITVHGRLYTAFVEMAGNQLSMKALYDIFPILSTLRRGDTYSRG